MPLTRDVQKPGQSSRAKFSQERCLNCPDCTGLCWSMIEMAHVPEQVLQPAGSAQA